MDAAARALFVLEHVALVQERARLGAWGGHTSPLSVLRERVDTRISEVVLSGDAFCPHKEELLAELVAVRLLLAGD